MKKTILAMSAAAALMMTGCGGSEAEATAPEKASAPEKAAPAEHAAAHTETHEKHWDYSENGPAHWDEFSKTCGTGHAQSPINIVPGKTMEMNHQYDLSMHEDVHTTAKVIDNGHSIKVTPKTGGDRKSVV